MSRYFLGWDCANKTLAHSYIEVNTTIISDLLAIAKNINEILRNGITGDNSDQLLAEIRMASDIIGSYVTYLSWGVKDILCGRKVVDTNEIDRTHCLHRHLITLPTLAQNTVTIIEHQPSKIGSKTNNKSTAVSHQLAMYFIEHDPIFVNPTAKNTITLHDDLTHDKFLAAAMLRYKNHKDAKYAANKAHSTANFKYFIKTMGLDHVIAGIPNAVMDDLADSTMQILAYMRDHKVLA